MGIIGNFLLLGFFLLVHCMFFYTFINNLILNKKCRNKEVILGDFVSLLTLKQTQWCLISRRDDPNYRYIEILYATLNELQGSLPINIRNILKVTRSVEKR